jgi:SHS2 domain-containing protein
MVAAEGVVCREWIPVTATGGDRETLLVAWLNELLYLHEARGIVAGEFRIGQVEGTTLTALVGGEAADPSRHCFLGHVKAATYHGLSLCRTRDGWEARVVVDV